MLNYDDALQKVLERMHFLEEEEKPLLDCVGQVLTENIFSDVTLPQANISGPDGYAVRSADIKGASRSNPVVLQITGTVRAGQTSGKKITPGTAIRIMTGSVIPDGADCVVRFEDTDEPGDKNGPNNYNPEYVRIYSAMSLGDNINMAGSNVRKGMLVMPERTLIGPAQISALASIGKAKIKVIRRPVVAIIATGDELVELGKPLVVGKTYNSNTAAIASLVAHYGGLPKIFGIARDKKAALTSKIRKGMMADAIITSGGASKGDYDLVRLVLGELGEIVFSRIKLGPGAALAFGIIPKLSDKKGMPSLLPVFALAGPPAGCLVNFETLVRPALLKMRGIESVDHPKVNATALDSINDRKLIPFAKWTNLTGREGKYSVELNMAGKTGVLSSMAAANSLTIVPEEMVVNAGDQIQVLPLDWCGYNIYS